MIDDLDSAILRHKTHCEHGFPREETCESCLDADRQRIRHQRIADALYNLSGLYRSASHAYSKPSPEDWRKRKYEARNLIRDLVEDWV